MWVSILGSMNEFVPLIQSSFPFDVFPNTPAVLPLRQTIPSNDLSSAASVGRGYPLLSANMEECLYGVSR